MIDSIDRIHIDAFVADMHCDTIIPMKRGYDISARNDRHHVDIPRLNDGGFDLQVFAMMVGNDVPTGERFRDVSESVEFLKAEIAKRSDRIAVCRSASEAESITSDGRIAALLALEGGGGLENDPANLDRFYRMGVRLITITHDASIDWCIRWKDENPSFHGLNDLGRDMIKEMNRLGIIVDLSHSAASTVEEVLKVSNRPVVASHSCAASICPHKRNLTDDQIKAIAGKGGVIGVAFVSFFLDERFSTELDLFWKKYADEMKVLMKLFSSEMDEESKRSRESEYSHIIEEFERTFEPIRPGIRVVADHIDHIVNLVGHDHVGIGSDFDGMEMPPVGLEDCTGMPNLTRELVERGYPEDVIRKILGGNFMRVLRKVCG